MREVMKIRVQGVAITLDKVRKGPYVLMASSGGIILEHGGEFQKRAEAIREFKLMEERWAVKSAAKVRSLA